MNVTKPVQNPTACVTAPKANGRVFGIERGKNLALIPFFLSQINFYVFLCVFSLVTKPLKAM